MPPFHQRCMEWKRSAINVRQYLYLLTGQQKNLKETFSNLPGMIACFPFLSSVTSLGKQPCLTFYIYTHPNVLRITIYRSIRSQVARSCVNIYRISAQKKTIKNVKNRNCGVRREDVRQHIRHSSQGKESSTFPWNDFCCLLAECGGPETRQWCTRDPVLSLCPFCFASSRMSLLFESDCCWAVGPPVPLVSGLFFFLPYQCLYKSLTFSRGLECQHVFFFFEEVVFSIFKGLNPLYFTSRFKGMKKIMQFNVVELKIPLI